MLSFLMLLSVVGVPASNPAPAPARYKIVTKTGTDIDLTAMGQPAMSILLTSSAFVSVTTTDTTGGKLVHIVVDSSTFDGGSIAASLPPAYTASPNGAVYHIYLVNGVASSPPIPSPTSVQAAQLVPGIELILAGMRHSTGGAGWVDTTKTEATELGPASTRITTWSTKPAAGGRMQTDGTWTAASSVNVGGNQMEMTMTGASHLTATPGGLSESASSSGKGQATMNMGGSSIPMKVTTEVTATAMP